MRPSLKIKAPEEQDPVYNKRKKKYYTVSHMEIDFWHPILDNFKIFLQT